MTLQAAIALYEASGYRKQPETARTASFTSAVSPKKPTKGGSRATLEALASARSTPATRAELKTTLETLGVGYSSEVHGVFTPVIPPAMQADARRFMQGRRGDALPDGDARPGG